MVGPIFICPIQSNEFKLGFTQMQLVPLLEFDAMSDRGDDGHWFDIACRGDGAEKKVALIDLYLEKGLLVVW